MKLINTERTFGLSQNLVIAEPWLCVDVYYVYLHPISMFITIFITMRFA